MNRHAQPADEAGSHRIETAYPPAIEELAGRGAGEPSDTVPDDGGTAPRMVTTTGAAPPAAEIAARYRILARIDRLIDAELLAIATRVEEIKGIVARIDQLPDADLLEVAAELEEIAVRGRDTVWCEVHGGLANPHFEQDDCVDPHLTDAHVQARVAAAARRRDG
jgi:hypothetical protein